MTAGDSQPAFEGAITVRYAIRILAFLLLYRIESPVNIIERNRTVTLTPDFFFGLFSTWIGL